MFVRFYETEEETGLDWSRAITGRCGNRMFFGDFTDPEAGHVPDDPPLDLLHFWIEPDENGFNKVALSRKEAVELAHSILELCGEEQEQ